MKLVSISTILLNHIVITKPSKSSAETNEISQYIHISVEPYRYNQATKRQCWNKYN